MQVVVNGILTNYSDSGRGKTLLLLHGWADSSATFSRLVQSMGRNYRFLIPDLPGFGGTEPPPEPWGLDEYAGFVEAWLDKIGRPKVDCLIGHSNGGAIAIRGLAEGRLGTDRLVLLASSGIRKPRRKVKMVAKVGKVLAVPLGKTAREKLRRSYYDSLGSEIFLLPQLEQSFRKIVSRDVLSDAAKLKMPTLLIYGSEDTATPLVYGQSFKKVIKGSNLEQLEGASHFLHQDEPEEVAKIIKGFLK